MKLVFYTPDKIPAVWPDAAPLFQKVVDKAVHGEFDVADLYRMAVTEKIVVCLVWEGTDAVMATAIEFIDYPKAIAANVLAMGGYGLKKVLDAYFPAVKQFCRSIGARWIECSVSPSMERIHKRFGYQTIYRNMRMEL